MEHFYYVYKITCLMDEWNGKFYIGKHFGKIDDNYTGSGRLIREYFAKYGRVKDVTYIKEIIDYGTEDNICDLEREYIREGMKSELCLNMICNSSKGCFGQKHSEERKNHISESLKGKKHSEETRKKIGESHKGMKHSDETKQKMRKPKSDEHKRNLSNSLKMYYEKRRNNG